MTELKMKYIPLEYARKDGQNVLQEYKKINIYVLNGVQRLRTPESLSEIKKHIKKGDIIEYTDEDMLVDWKKVITVQQETDE